MMVYPNEYSKAQANCLLPTTLCTQKKFLLLTSSTPSPRRQVTSFSTLKVNLAIQD